MKFPNLSPYPRQKQKIKIEKPPSPFYSVVKIRIVKEKQKCEKKDLKEEHKEERKLVKMEYDSKS